MVNHDIWINKIKWKSVMHEFEKMNKLILDCFEYSFKDGLEREQQMQLIDFMGNSDRLNSLSTADFCNFFLDKNIKFTLKFRYCRKRSISDNYNAYRMIKNINKQMREL